MKRYNIKAIIKNVSGRILASSPKDLIGELLAHRTRKNIIPRSPDFIGIGVQKAGTTWLCANLRRHPHIWMPAVKEIHYFDRKLKGSSTLPAFCDDLWYRLLFSPAPESSKVGEITPRYALCGDEEIAHMHAVAPDAKLLFLLRHPVERFWSQCQMAMASGNLAAGDTAAMQFFDFKARRYRGEYSKSIVRFCRQYDPSQMLLIFYDAIVKQPQRVMLEVFAFLGLSDFTIDPLVLSQRVNTTAINQPMSETLRRKITMAYREEMEILADVLGGYASNWVGTGSIDEHHPAVVRLSATHVIDFDNRCSHSRTSCMRKT